MLTISVKRFLMASFVDPVDRRVVSVGEIFGAKTSLNIGVYICMCVCVFVCLYVCACVHVCVCIYVYVCLRVCECVHA
jgi:hypothetical protein